MSLYHGRLVEIDDRWLLQIGTVNKLLSQLKIIKITENKVKKDDTIVLV